MVSRKGNKEKTEVMLSLSVPDTQHLPPTLLLSGVEIAFPWPFKVKQNKLSHFLSKEGQFYVVVVVVCLSGKCKSGAQSPGQGRPPFQEMCTAKAIPPLPARGHSNVSVAGAETLRGGNVCTSK